MNKQKITFIVYMLSTLIILTGCADKGTLGQSGTVGDTSEFNSESNESPSTGAETGLVPIAEVRESFEAEAKKIKSRRFDNINFEDAYFSFTEANEFYTLEYKNYTTTSSWAADDAYDYMCKRLDELFPGLYSDEQKAMEIRFGDAPAVNRDTAEGSYRWPNLEQYKELGLETDCPVPCVTNKDIYIEIYGGALRGYDLGELKRRGGYNLEALTSHDIGYGYRDDGDIDLFDVLIAYPIVYRTTNLKSERTFHTVTGDLSIADAVSSANKALSELELSPKGLPFKPAVQSVNVLDIGDNCFAFCFDVVTEYKQVKFNALEMDRNTASVQTLYDSTHEIDMPGVAVMYEKDKITRYKMDAPFAISDVAETNSHASVIPLEKAAELVSDYYTDKMNFKALSATAVYKKFSAKDFDQYSDDDDYKHREITVNPCWRFVLQPTTGDTSKLYYVYVDMVSGKIGTVVQLMKTDMEYE